VLKTLGFSNLMVLGLVIAESLIMALVGGTLGLAVTWVSVSQGSFNNAFLPVFIMRSRDIGLLPICDGSKLVGVLSDRDITVRATANNLHPEQLRGQDIVTSDVVCCFEDQDVDEARAMMQDHKVRRLPVVNRQSNLVGMLALSDIAIATGDNQSTGIAIQQVSIPDAPKPLPGQKRE
jgi:CBS-domain-containing membrane protein